MCTADQVRAGMVKQSTFHEWCHSTVSTAQTTLLAVPSSIGLFDMDYDEKIIHVPDPDKFMLTLTLYIALVALCVGALVKLTSIVTHISLYFFCPMVSVDKYVTYNQ